MALDPSSTRKYQVPELHGGLSEQQANLNDGEGPYGYKRGVEGFTNEVIRKRLAAEWRTMGKDEQLRLRAVRAKRGFQHPTNASKHTIAH